MQFFEALNAPGSALAVLTAMITPAVLISACGTLVLSTSMRLARVLDRARSLPQALEELEQRRERVALFDDHRAIILQQVTSLARRGRLLQLSLSLFYLGIAIFVATSVTIGMAAGGFAGLAWVPVATALLGAGTLLAGSLILILESRIALSSTMSEMNFMMRFGQDRS